LRRKRGRAQAIQTKGERGKALKRIMLSKMYFTNTCAPCESEGAKNGWSVNWLDGNSKLRNKHFTEKTQAVIFMHSLKENDYNMLITLSERAA
jgi:hypothetical protein